MFRDDGAALSDAAQRKRWQPARIITLLFERRLRNAGAVTPMLLLEVRPHREIPGTEAIRVSDLLAQWPQTVPERIDRCLCNLANYAPIPGHHIILKLDSEDRKRNEILFFSDHHDETRYYSIDYYIDALAKYGWVSTDGSDMRTRRLVITPEGWKRVGELAGGAERRRNPAFVAIWFGGREHRDKMDRLWLDFMKPAIEAAGYHAKRADTDEHNEPIMDRVVEDIRRAPFVVAELSDDNNGVYYEAGFAKGRGIEVIYCSREGHKPHFDVTGINLVKWKDEADLRTRLENRVLGSMGRGPYDFSKKPSDELRAHQPRNPGVSG